VANISWDAKGIIFGGYSEKGKTGDQYYASLIHCLKDEVKNK
jgi:hypothetical protein